MTRTGYFNSASIKSAAEWPCGIGSNVKGDRYCGGKDGGGGVGGVWFSMMV
jgi:hypothetical protein